MKLEVKNICKSFGEKEVLHDISFEVESGHALGLLGRNGAGKTTTIRILMDVFKADSGTILLDGKEFVPRRHQIGYLPEERGLYPKKTVLEQMVYLARLRGIARKPANAAAMRWLERLQVASYANNKLETLSKGNQQKVQLAATLVADPEIVILDEPFSGLDPVNAQLLKEVVQEIIQDGRIVIFSSHQMSYVEEFCDDIVIIHGGNVVLKGNLAQIKREESRHRITMRALNYEPEQLAQICRAKFSNIVKVETIRKQEIICSMVDGQDFSRILKELLDTDVQFAQFGIYEPSLNDIFVERAGEEN